MFGKFIIHTCSQPICNLQRDLPYALEVHSNRPYMPLQSFSTSFNLWALFAWHCKQRTRRCGEVCVKNVAANSTQDCCLSLGL